MSLRVAVVVLAVAAAMAAGGVALGASDSQSVVTHAVITSADGSTTQESCARVTLPDGQHNIVDCTSATQGTVANQQSIEELKASFLNRCGDPTVVGVQPWSECVSEVLAAAGATAPPAGAVAPPGGRRDCAATPPDGALVCNTGP